MIRFKHKGDFSKTTSYLKQLNSVTRRNILDKYGRMGVEALSSATPVESGTTAAAWSYEIENSSKGVKLVFLNSNVNKGVPVAIILQYGHGTGTGGWVQGRDYINPAIQPIFDQMVEDIWKEVTKL